VHVRTRTQTTNESARDSLIFSVNNPKLGQLHGKARPVVFRKFMSELEQAKALVTNALQKNGMLDELKVFCR
jgi:hypothetical protein